MAMATYWGPVFVAVSIVYAGAIIASAIRYHAEKNKS